MYAEKEMKLHKKIADIFKNCNYEGRKEINEWERVQLDYYYKLLELIERNLTNEQRKERCEYEKAYRRELLRDIRKYGISRLSFESQFERVTDELKNYPGLIVKCTIENCLGNSCKHDYHHTPHNV